MINKCQYSNCGKDFKTDKKDKKFCSNNCFTQNKKENPELYSSGRFKSGMMPWNKKRVIVKEFYDLNKSEDVLEIVNGCKSNIRAFQKILFEMTYGKCMVIAMRYTHDNDSAQDILSDSFIKVFKNLHSFNLNGSIEGWIKRIVANTAVDSLRKNKKTFVMDSDDMIHFDEMSASDDEFELDGMEEIKEIPTSEILEEIQNLPIGYRTCFSMFVFEKMTHKEIGEKLGIVEGTSKSNVSKARLILKQKIKEKILCNQIIQNKRVEAFRLVDVSC